MNEEICELTNQQLLCPTYARSTAQFTTAVTIVMVNCEQKPDKTPRTVGYPRSKSIDCGISRPKKPSKKREKGVKYDLSLNIEGQRLCQQKSYSECI